MRETIGHVDVPFTSSLRPWDSAPEQYWIEVVGRTMALPAEALTMPRRNRLAPLMVRIAEARDDGVSLSARRASEPVKWGKFRV